MFSDDLSPRRQQILDCIVSTTRDRGYPPTVREIGQAVGLTSSSSVHFHLRALEKAGYLERDGSLTRALRPRPFRQSQPSRYVPLVGKVAAGAPILAEDNIEELVDVPGFLRRDDDDFVLRVQGDSMADAGIYNGDFIVVHSQDQAENGEIVVALVEDEATTKRFYRDGHPIRLEPENELYEPIIVNADEVQLVGKVVGVLRQL